MLFVHKSIPVKAPVFMSQNPSSTMSVLSPSISFWLFDCCLFYFIYFLSKLKQNAAPCAFSIKKKEKPHKLLTSHTISPYVEWGEKRSASGLC